VRVSELLVGEHTLSLHITPSSLNILHHTGPTSLELLYHLPDDAALAPLALSYGPPPEEVADADGRWLRLTLAPGQQALIEATEDGVTVRVPDRREEQPGDGLEAPVVGATSSKTLTSG
jgi:hypothetical protein